MEGRKFILTDRASGENAIDGRYGKQKTKKNQPPTKKGR